MPNTSSCGARTRTSPARTCCRCCAQARAAGTQLVLIDPVAHRTAGLCDRFIQPRPAADFALAMAVAALLFERGWVDPAAAQYCDNLDQLRALAESQPVATWCQRADVPVADAEDLARRLDHGPTAILVGWGMGRRAVGGAIVRALDALAAISGNLGVAGGGVSFYFKRRGAFALDFIRGLAGGAALDLRAAVRPRGAGRAGSADPRAVDHRRQPGGDAAGFGARWPRPSAPASCAVVVDPFLTDTARLATCVLPTTTLLEADDLLGAYGHHQLGEARPVVAPPPGVKSDLEIMQALAERVGLARRIGGQRAGNGSSG